MNKQRRKYRECERKVKYKAREEAKKAIVRLIATTGTYPARIGYYRCPWCGNLHVGRRRQEGFKWI